jgi:mannose-1-phosphate guanylyltransferase
MRHAIIMAGGSGTRFWPASRERRPKQFLGLANQAPLLRATYERISGIVPPQRTWVVTSAAHIQATTQLLPELPESNLLAEPCGRDTSACAAFSAARLLKDDSDATCLVLPADHVIGELDRYHAAMNAGLDHVANHGGLLTFGIRPTQPETGYGYLEVGAVDRIIGEWAVHRLERFIEKPDSGTAAEMVASGKHLWNSGIFAWQASDLIDEVRRQLPDLADGIDRLRPVLGTSGEDEALAQIYPTLPRTSIDYGVMEGALSSWTLPVDFPWSDVGSWPALAQILPNDEAGNAVSGPALALDARGNVLVSEGPTIAVLGASNLVVVATEDAVLVVPIDQAQRVKEIVAELRRQGREDLL